METKRYNISEGLHFEVPESEECFHLDYLPDNTSILISVKEIGKMIEALKGIKADYETKILEEVDRDKLKRWIGENE